MELVVQMLLLAGAFMNVCALAYLVGIAYVAPMAFTSPLVDQTVLLLLGVVITVSTLVAGGFWRQDKNVPSLIAMYAWWVVGIWFINELISSTFRS